MNEGTMVQPTILIVEDEPLIRMCAVDFAEEAGYAALEAKDAGEALAFLEGPADIAVLFTDITLPGPLDGLELADLVAARWPGIKVMLASGALTGLGAEVAPGAFRLPKPYGLDQFLQALEAVTAVADGVR
jgi:two-component system, response regulator PdtaR